MVSLMLASLSWNPSSRSPRMHFDHALIPLTNSPFLNSLRVFHEIEDKTHLENKEE
uniref:Uncharacterized protein MANES_01G184100 n=1 Tax=Rhizophora mucronata TaxID=61149 RepID=A0A2P2PQK9_RHIMU